MQRAIILATLLALLAVTAAAPTFGQEQSYTVDQLEQRCVENGAEFDLSDTCLFLLFTVLVPEAGRAPPDLSTGTDGTASDEPVSRSGSGDAQTAPFDLTGGDYEIAIEASDVGGEFSAGCVLFNALRSTDGAVLEQGGDLDMGPGQTSADSTFVFGIPAGRYYFDMNTSCDSWGVAIAPL